MTAGSWGEARVDAQAKRRYVKDEKQIPCAAARHTPHARAAACGSKVRCDN